MSEKKTGTNELRDLLLRASETVERDWPPFLKTGLEQCDQVARVYRETVASSAAKPPKSE